MRLRIQDVFPAIKGTNRRSPVRDFLRKAITSLTGLYSEMSLMMWNRIPAIKGTNRRSPVRDFLSVHMNFNHYIYFKT
jgi:hypothetical protein